VITAVERREAQASVRCGSRGVVRHTLGRDGSSRRGSADTSRPERVRPLSYGRWRVEWLKHRRFVSRI
jgi:hypothetical protein